MATKSPLCNYSGTIEELRAGDTLNGASGGGASVIDIQKFTANGTWTKPTGAKWVEVILWGGGAGGGSGSRQATNTVAGGGAPGSGGGLTFAQIDASLLGATESVTVGATATGGAIVSTDSTSGNMGALGNASIFANFRGSGGSRGSAAGTSGGSAPISSSNYYGWVLTTGATNQGGAGSTFPSPSQGTSVILAGSGGGGGSVDGSNNAVRGGNGMDVFGQYSGISLTGGARGTQGGTPTDGSNGTDVTFATQKQIMGGSGGGGGGSSATAIAKKGGNGGIPGGGGGGGGGSRNGFASGAGGDGARGEVWVITFF